MSPTAVQSLTSTSAAISLFPDRKRPFTSGAPFLHLKSTGATTGPTATSTASAELPLPTSRPRPIPNSYWATSLVIASEYPWAPYTSAAKLDALLAAGARTFIDLTESGELSPYLLQLSARAASLSIDPSTIEYYRFPIPDRCLPSSVDYMRAILDILRDNEARGRICVVHCRGGVGRTGMVIGCWLVQSGLVKNGEEALVTIDRKWRTVEKSNRFPHSPETGPQFEFVRTFARKRTAV